MVLGNMDRDGGNLILSKEEKDSLLLKYPKALSLLRGFHSCYMFYIQSKQEKPHKKITLLNEASVKLLFNVNVYR